MVEISGTTLFFALLGGILPALLWLWFWLREDKARPEPRGMIFLSFVVGMLVIPFAILLEKGVEILLEKEVIHFYFSGTVWFVFAAIEELLKYGAGYLFVLRRKSNDEPIDGLIYMITIALGFAALENALFLLDPLIDGGIIQTILTGNFRFLGATLLHTLASAVVGASIALGFYKTPGLKKLYVSIGLVLAIVLHATFNFFIINSNGEKLLLVFFFVWVGIIALILLFEKVKKLYNRDLIE
ncbi:PrsW family intramembrane metalloprotease [Patescibacteria group bacterium]|nr:PrsW family intramembrane metalloprotease [Patescibacteria group bacterium]MCH8889256.1 PrsW family intramembrane metalloprotease [Patescibacteria group bacterium]